MEYVIRFLKVSGAGNDFILVDNMNSSLSVDWSSHAKAVCDRRSGVGGDGLLVLEKSDCAPFRMLYFNADGSSGGMCGNGGRCVARYAAETGIDGGSISFEACGSIYHAEVYGAQVRLKMNDIAPISSPTEFRLQGSTLQGWVVDTGSPHVVIDADPDRIEVEQIGAEVRNHPLVAHLGGANVNFLVHTGGSTVALRTFERGVEAETLACGTGAVAAAAVSVHRSMVSSPVSVSVRSGEHLVVSLRETGSGFSDVWLEGSTSFLFSGSLLADEKGNVIGNAPLITSQKKS